MHNPAMRNEVNQVEYVLGDWGTSRLRLFLMTDDAAAAYIEGPGIAALASHSPEQRLDVLSQLLASWSSPAGSSQVLLCGMAGARNGLVEVPYARLPLDSSKWLIGATTLQTQSLAITIAAGVCSCGPGSSVDVMRGEETQVFGAMQLDPDLGRGSHVLLLPGTHSKWILVSDGSIVRFRTAMTGELFALLREHSTLFRVSTHGDDRESDPAAEREGFAAGVSRSRDGKLLAALFQARAGQLLEDRSPCWASGFVSGLLIGCEVGGFSETFRTAASACIIGDGALAARYRQVFAARNLLSHSLDGDECAITGLQYLRRHLSENR
ncbi:MAG TPA: 2-dehydro-3-deoxygalactonokinase [Woeseiaceae bacterium]|nr:2-dehydro-3-deoxygalactonokinase [Woeseiaceae bacterium]